MTVSRYQSRVSGQSVTLAPVLFDFGTEEYNPHCLVLTSQPAGKTKNPLFAQVEPENSCLKPTLQPNIDSEPAGLISSGFPGWKPHFTTFPGSSGRCRPQFITTRSGSQDHWPLSSQRDSVLKMNTRLPVPRINRPMIIGQG